MSGVSACLLLASTSARCRTRSRAKPTRPSLHAVMSGVCPDSFSTALTAALFSISRRAVSSRPVVHALRRA
eukprot:803410-Rhodomonas_salina.1